LPTGYRRDAQADRRTPFHSLGDCATARSLRQRRYGRAQWPPTHRTAVALCMITMGETARVKLSVHEPRPPRGRPTPPAQPMDSNFRSACAWRTSKELRPDEILLIRNARLLQFTAAGVDWVPTATCRGIAGCHQPRTEAEHVRHIVALALAAASACSSSTPAPQCARIQPAQRQPDAARRSLAPRLKRPASTAADTAFDELRNQPPRRKAPSRPAPVITNVVNILELRGVPNRRQAGSNHGSCGHHSTSVRPAH
jgi:hypothetical protein